MSNLNFFPAVTFGATVRSTRPIALSAGRHTIAVQCAGVWSDDNAFFWEPK
jgi:hypothetical protein